MKKPIILDSSITCFTPHRRDVGQLHPIRSLQELADISTQCDISLQTYRGSHRTNANFIQTDFMVEDDDSGTPVTEVVDRHREHACIVLTTRHHKIEKHCSEGVIKPPCDRTRTILLADRRITDAQVLKYNYERLLAENPQLDQNVKDPARMLFAAKEVAYVNESGSRFKILHPVKQQAHAASVPAGTVAHKPDERGELSTRTKQFLNLSVKGRAKVRWHEEFIFAVQDIKAQRYSLYEGICLLEAVTGYLDETDRHQIYDVWDHGRSFVMSFRPKSKDQKKGAP